VNSTSANKNDIVANGTCPAGVTTPIGGTTGAGDSSVANTMALVIGDVGTYSIGSEDEATTIVAAGFATLSNYIIATIVGTGGDQKAVTAGQVVSLGAPTPAQITW
jgi:hypothetical protein